MPRLKDQRFRLPNSVCHPCGAATRYKVTGYFLTGCGGGDRPDEQETEQGLSFGLGGHGLNHLGR